LQNVGDCKRFFRWCILSLKAGKLDRQTASILGQLGTYLLRAIEGHDLEARLKKLEEEMRNTEDRYEEENRHHV